MIDTIALRFHGLNHVKDTTLARIHKETTGRDTFAVPEHNDLYLKMLEKKGKNFFVQRHISREIESSQDLTPEQFANLQNHKGQGQIRDVVIFQDEQKVKEIYKRINGKYQVPSSHNAVTFSINENGSFVDFTLSIPKYLYGHSLAQFVPQSGTDFQFAHMQELMTWKGQTKYLHKRLMKFIDTFFHDLLVYFELDTYPNKMYVELRRIDLCFNQWFESKAKALKYLEMQKKINRRRQSEKNKQGNNYFTSLEYTSRSGAYFKIYHKGTEYSESAHGDLKRHLDINREFIEDRLRKSDEKLREAYYSEASTIHNIFESRVRGNTFIIQEDKRAELKKLINIFYKWLPYDVDFFKAEMDKVLRYEISLKGDFFSYAFKTKVFRRNDPVHQEYYQMFKDVKNLYKSAGGAPIKLKKKQIANYKMFNKWITRKCGMVLSNAPMLERFCTTSSSDYSELHERYRITRCSPSYTILADKDVFPFNEYFLKHCVQYFKSFFDHYQVHRMEAVDDLATQIETFNDKVDQAVENYNNFHQYKMYDVFGNLKRLPSGKPVTAPVQLLKQSERKELGLQKINTSRLFMVFREMERGYSLDEVRKRLKIPKQTFSRLKSDLQNFGIHQQTITMHEEITAEKDFRQYYWITDGINARKKFFPKRRIKLHKLAIK